jgi:hypothetical protein
MQESQLIRLGSVARAVAAAAYAGFGVGGGVSSRGVAFHFTRPGARRATKSAPESKIARAGEEAHRDSVRVRRLGVGDEARATLSELPADLLGRG